MSGRRAKANRRAHREISADASCDYVIEPEYPALTPYELAEPATARLRKSRLAFENAGAKVTRLKSDDFYDKLLGDQKHNSHASASKVDEWIEGWRMPADPGVPDVKTSLTTYVGIVESRNMPSSSSGLKGKVPYSLITTKFIEFSWKLTEIFPFFIKAVVPLESAADGAKSREILFAHLGVARDPGNLLDEHVDDHELIQELIDAVRDEILSERITSAAIRWAIAHEMAHIHGSERDRTDAYSRAEQSYPNIVREQWEPKRNDLSNFAGSIKSYKNEIACDLLANQYVLGSPFAVDDIITQALGSLVALEALVWDGYDLDKAKVSETHPSPALRFEIVARDWKRILADPATWARCDAPGVLAQSDFAHMLAFGKWAHGAYGELREGARWGFDIYTARSELECVVPEWGTDHFYALHPEGSLRARIRR